MMTLDEALRYERWGFSLVPVVPRGKQPFGKLLPQVDGKPSWKGYQSKRATEGEIRGWFERYPRLNLAAVCGAVSGGLIVLDFDLHAAENFERWRALTRPLSDLLPVVQTGKGRHVYFRYLGEGRSIQLAQTEAGGILIESRGEGGLCLLPPSTHPSGKRYTWLAGDGSRLPLLKQRQYLFLLGAAASLNRMEEVVYVPSPIRKGKETAVGGQMEKRLRAYADAVLGRLGVELAATGRGGRNAKLNASSYVIGRYVGAGLLGEVEVTAVLEQACLANGSIPEDGHPAFERTLQSGLTAGKENCIDVDKLGQKLINSTSSSTNFYYRVKFF